MGKAPTHTATDATAAVINLEHRAAPNPLCHTRVKEVETG
jgi:hypothetical protein